MATDFRVVLSIGPEGGYTEEEIDILERYEDPLFAFKKSYTKSLNLKIFLNNSKSWNYLIFIMHPSHL